MADSIESQIERKFATTESNLEADVLTELQSIIHLHSIDVEELWYKWESYIMKMGSNEMKLNIETARNLKRNIQDELEADNRIKVHQLHQFSNNKRSGGTKNPRVMVDMLDGLVSNTPGDKGLTSRSKFEINSTVRVDLDKPSISLPPKISVDGENQHEPIGVTSFQERANAGHIIQTLNEHLPKPEHPIAPFSEPRIKLTANSDIKKLSYKTMAMKCSEASEVLDDKIDEYMFMIQDYHKIEESQFGSAASQSTNEIIAIGRIATDTLDGKLNANSLMLETSRRVGAGLRIPLKVDSLHSFQFFPGQIVALKGINTSGDSFVVSEILEPPLLPGAASTIASLRQHHQRLTGGSENLNLDSKPIPLNIIIGAGPFTADENLDFEPLKALCMEASDSLADALILIGPFLDIDHPLIANGDFHLPADVSLDPDMVSMSSLFRYFITPSLSQLVDLNPHISIILVPSVRDAVSKHVSWPQEPFQRKDLGLPKSVRIIGNPMVISLNEIAFGISSQDILTELRISEVVGKNPKDTSLLARLPKYLIEQRSFFPVFPPIDRKSLPKTGTSCEISTGAMLDTGYLRLGDIINARPDVIIVPSALPPFAKVPPPPKISIRLFRLTLKLGRGRCFGD
ncbi:DNA polymerase alpha subunit B [Golovinomyces cichoracearum]|uniref:DNA polymerase alpha subunit B n=1 Tax=Golovinomyces cichoracearum TaxID=62708 RepID=A0A420IK04_9PEZI|nr:DNA polymerase alpha subunit B [Golovinomyces cichoracearum]